MSVSPMQSDRCHGGGHDQKLWSSSLTPCFLEVSVNASLLRLSALWSYVLAFGDTMPSGMTNGCSLAARALPLVSRRWVRQEREAAAAPQPIRYALVPYPDGSLNRIIVSSVSCYIIVTGYLLWLLGNSGIHTIYIVKHYVLGIPVEA